MKLRVPLLVLLASLLAACGGGGGGAASNSPPVVVAAPQIVTSPQDASVQLGKSASFTVSATGQGTLSYQWSKNGTAIPGATSATLSIPAVTASDNGVKFAVLVANSGGSATSSSATLSITFVANSGVAQKGPLQIGSTVTAQELNAGLSPTGRQFTYQILSDLGTFAPTSDFGARFIGTTATGYYFDEVSDQISAGTITLNGYHDLASDSALNVNLLTTLAYQRIRNLVVGGMDFAAARAQAEAEVLAAFGIRSAAGFASFGTLDIGTNTNAGHALAAISSIFVQGRTSGEVNLLVARVQADIGANGAIVDTTLRASLMASAAALDAEVVAANLNQKYASLGVSFTTASIDDWLDRDGDGLAARFEFRVLRATSASTFTLPAALTNAYAGKQVSVSGGNLKVNGNAATAPITIQAGDVLTVTPSAGFANGLLAAYLQTGTTRIGKVTFAGHGTWSRTASLAAKRFGQTATLLQSGKVIVVGGQTGNCDLRECTARSTLASTEIYDPATDSWVSGAKMASPRAYHTVTLLANGKLLATGGTDNDWNVLSSAEIYDPATNSWTPAASMSVARMQHAASRMANGKVLVTGTTNSWLASAEIYDAVANTWTAAPSMAASRGLHTSTLLQDGTVLVTGGSEGGNSSWGAERYDPVTNTWAQGQTMVYRRAIGFTTTLLPSGKLLLVGGTDSDNKSSAEIYDPLVPTHPAPPPPPPPYLPTIPPVEAWSLVENMSIGRTGHSATLLSDGRVLVAGGFSFPTDVASAEIFDPVTNHWASTGSYEASRSGNTLTLLNDGSVLAAGGHGLTGAILASCELYW